MSRLTLTYVLALMIVAGQAVAQTTYSQTTTRFTPAPSPPAYITPPIAPPEGTLSVNHSRTTIAPDGTRTRTDETTYRNSNGVADDRVTRTTVTPPVVTSVTRSTTTVTK